MKKIARLDEENKRLKPQLAEAMIQNATCARRPTRLLAEIARLQEALAATRGHDGATRWPVAVA